MSVILAPTTYAEAATARAENPGAMVVAGGTDIMVAVNAGHMTVPRWITLDRVAGRSDYIVDGPGNTATLAAGVTFGMLGDGVRAELPALAQAARTVGSPQIRAAATLGGNLVTASPAADALPVLACYDAEFELVGQASTRRVTWSDFLTGPKTTALAADEVLSAVHLKSTGGRQWFAKVGTRNAMVISICTLAGRLDTAFGEARLAFGSASPTVRRAPEAEALLLSGAPPAEVGAAVAAAADPIDDHRASADYRRRALATLGARLATWLREPDARGVR